jgi:oxygen-independent coproporphyrinogen-3 oxidase
MTTRRTVRSLYVHVPYCRTLCAYCDFYSEILDERTSGALVDGLLRELAAFRRAHDLAPDTIFLGGGTPTVLPPLELSRLLDAIVALPRAAGDLEFTVEANPATVNAGTAELLATHAVSRVSVGAQSFDPAELRVLERTHEPAQVRETVAICRAHGIAQVNLDLIFGVPGQSVPAWESSLRQAADLAPDHISCYGLTYEPGTRLDERRQAGEVVPVSPETEAQMYETAIDTLAEAGLEQYEISNFARPGCRCRHNLRIWRNETYAGIGPSAAGFANGVRYRNLADIREYLRAVAAGRRPRAEQECLTPERRACESAMLELRLIAGIDRVRFAERFGRDPVELFAEAVARHAEAGLLTVDERSMRLTRRGLLVADSVIADFL